MEKNRAAVACLVLETRQCICKKRIIYQVYSHCLENHKGYYLRNSDKKEECSCCSSSRDDLSVSGTC